MANKLEQDTACHQSVILFVKCELPVRHTRRHRFRAIKSV